MDGGAVGGAAHATGHPEGFDAAQLEAARQFIAVYARHLQTEDAFIFPVVTPLLDADALHGMGEEMATRRGARRVG